MEELRSKLAGVSVTSSSGGTLQSSRASNKSIATKEEVKIIFSFILQVSI